MQFLLEYMVARRARQSTFGPSVDKKKMLVNCTCAEREEEIARQHMCTLMAESRIRTALHSVRDWLQAEMIAPEDAGEL